MTMPITPTTSTQASARPNRAPVAVAATRSPMSTKPPTAVRMPSATSRSFFTRAPSLMRPRELVQLAGDPSKRRGQAGHRAEVAAAGGRAQRRDGRGGRVQQVVQLGLELVGAPVGRLDGVEGALDRAGLVASLGQHLRQVSAERLVAGGGLDYQPGVLDRRCLL